MEGGAAREGVPVDRVRLQLCFEFDFVLPGRVALCERRDVFFPSLVLAHVSKLRPRVMLGARHHLQSRRLLLVALAHRLLLVPPVECQLLRLCRLLELGVAATVDVGEGGLVGGGQIGRLTQTQAERTRERSEGRREMTGALSGHGQLCDGREVARERLLHGELRAHRCGLSLLDSAGPGSAPFTPQWCSPRPESRAPRVCASSVSAVSLTMMGGGRERSRRWALKAN